MSRDWLIRAGIVVVLAFVFGALCLYLSGRQGRLASVPNYDDAVYFLSATRLIEAWRGSADGVGGSEAVIGELESKGLHSPWSVGLATAAYVAFGYHDWAPYVLNVFGVLALLAACGWMIRALPLVEWTILLIFQVTLPFSTLLMVEFRPDLVWAVTLGFCALYGLTVPNYGSKYSVALVHAGLCAAALLVKPSTFAMTGIVFGYSVLARIGGEFAAGRRISSGRIAGTILIQAVAVVVLTAPFSIPFGKETWTYFWTNSFGANEAIWNAGLPVVERWFYYGAGYGAANNLGWAGLVPAAAIVIAGAKAFLRWRDDPRSLVEWIAIFGLLILTYSLSSGFGMKSPFLGGAFVGSFVMAGVYYSGVVIQAIIDKSQARRWLPRVCLAIVSIGSAMVWHWPPYARAQASEAGRNTAAVERQVIEILEPLELDRNLNLLFTQSGPLIRENVEMWLLRRGHWTESVKGGFFGSSRNFRNKLKGADLVFVQEPAMQDAFLNLPAERLLGEWLIIMESSPTFRLAGSAVGRDGKKLLVYIREGSGDESG